MRSKVRLFYGKYMFKRSFKISSCWIQSKYVAEMPEACRGVLMIFRKFVVNLWLPLFLTIWHAPFLQVRPFRGSSRKRFRQGNENGKKRSLKSAEGSGTVAKRIPKRCHVCENCLKKEDCGRCDGCGVVRGRRIACVERQCTKMWTRKSRACGASPDRCGRCTACARDGVAVVTPAGRRRRACATIEGLATVSATDYRCDNGRFLVVRPRLSSSDPQLLKTQK
jgi:hypothetical protein